MKYELKCANTTQLSFKLVCWFKNQHSNKSSKSFLALPGFLLSRKCCIYKVVIADTYIKNTNKIIKDLIFLVVISKTKTKTKKINNPYCIIPLTILASLSPKIHLSFSHWLLILPLPKKETVILPFFSFIPSIDEGNKWAKYIFYYYGLPEHPTFNYENLWINNWGTFSTFAKLSRFGRHWQSAKIQNK